MHKCKPCGFSGCKSLYDRHVSTKKHENTVKIKRNAYYANYMREYREKNESEEKKVDDIEEDIDNDKDTAPKEKTYTQTEVELLLIKKELELRDAKIEAITKEKDYDVKLLKKDIEMEKNKNEFMADKLEDCQKTVVTNKTMTKQMATTTKFLLKKFGNAAPPFSRLTATEATNLLKYDTYQENKVEEKIKVLKMDKNYSEEREMINMAKIISNKIENKSIIDWICTKVLKKYKKNKIEKQSLWNTDKSRLHFVIKELIMNECVDTDVDNKKVTNTVTKKVVKKVTKKVAKKATVEDIDDQDAYDQHDETLSGFWKEDPQGDRVTEMIIRPILEVVEKILLDGMIKLTNKLKSVDKIKGEQIDILKTTNQLGDISVSHGNFKQVVLDGTLEKKILSKIAAKLYLNKKPELK